jgi:hypothetical protein
MKITTGITNGRPIDEHLLEDAYKSYEGKRVDIEVKRHTERRTNPQNSYLWGVMLKMIADYAEGLGYDFKEEDWYAYYVSKGYFGWKEMLGERVPKGSSESDKFEFNQAKEKLQREWAERGLSIPDPQEKDYRAGKEYQPPKLD